MAPRRSRRPASVQRLVATVVSALLALGVAAWQGWRGTSVARPPDARPPAVRPEAPADLSAIDAPALRTQIGTVVDAMDRTGRPPAGVAQGGRRGGSRGLFENAEGRLPAQPRGYYTETDVWPRGPDGRGAERLVFGRDREVWYSPDHYRTFVRLR